MTYNQLIDLNYKKAVEGIDENMLNGLNTRWYDYITSLPTPIQLTYMIVIMDNQIFNGGLHQYFVNGYGQFVKETIEFLKKIKSFKRAEVLGRAIEIVNNKGYSNFSFREKLIRKQLEELFVSDELVVPLSNLNNEYDQIPDEDIEYLLGNYLSLVT